MTSSEQTTHNPVAKSDADNNDSTSAPTKSEDQNVTKKSPAKPASIITVIFTVVLLAAAAGGYYYWQKFETYLQKIQHDAQIIDKKISTVIPQLDQAQKDIFLHKEEFTLLTAQINKQNEQIKAFDESQKALISSTKNIFDITHRNQTQWLLSEVSYLLSLANQRLIVSRDIKTAIAALKAANNRLHDLSDPSLLNLRKTISNETAQLNLLKLPDISGIAFSIDNMTSLIKDLPFKSAQQKLIEGKIVSEKLEIASLDKDSLVAPLWDRLKSLVTIKKHQRDIQETETPLQKNDIDNQIRYRLETSRVSLINKNTTVFQHEISSALKLVTLYYNQNDNRVANLVTELESLSKIDLLPTLPDITASWLKLQKFIAVTNAGDVLKKNKGKSIK